MRMSLLRHFALAHVVVASPLLPFRSLCPPYMLDVTWRCGIFRVARKRGGLQIEIGVCLVEFSRLSSSCIGVPVLQGCVFLCLKTG